MKKFKNNLMLAPLAGYTDAGFRQLCVEAGCGTVVTEMISAMALKQGNKITFEMLEDEFCGTDDALRCVQLFGHNEDVFKEVISLDEIQKFDVIDINMGCPMPKIVRNCEGSYLMYDKPRAAKIIKAVVKYSGKPVSVKFRKGFKVNTAVEFAKLCEDCGASFVTVHGRTQEQMYGGKADWDVIADVVKNVSIPVFANGDIRTRDDLTAVLNRTGAFGAAIGRAALGKPFLFSELLDLTFDVDIAGLISRHIEILLKVFREDIVLNEMKKHYVWYFKGAKNSKAVLNELFCLKSVGAQLRLIEEFFK